jgi:hypothetical protein
MLIRE